MIKALLQYIRWGSICKEEKGGDKMKAYKFIRDIKEIISGQNKSQLFSFIYIPLT
jgi:hypothetical protein